MILANGKR